jgi:hypothetical protein
MTELVSVIANRSLEPTHSSRPLLPVISLLALRGLLLRAAQLQR